MTFLKLLHLPLNESGSKKNGPGLNMDLSNIKIETNRLLLISAETMYASAIFHEYRPPVSLFMLHPPPASAAIVEERILARKNKMRKGLDLHLIVLLKRNRAFLGSFSLEGLQGPNPEMGGWLKRDSQGKGYGKEVVKAMKDWADVHLNYQSIIWPCAKANIASCRLAESLNGIVKKEYQAKNQFGKTYDYLEYHIEKVVSEKD